MYRCPTLVDLMVWQNVNKSNDGLICSVCDSKVWKHIDTNWPDFCQRSSVALDEVNPHVDLSTNHFTWPILLPNYNLPPWLTTKCFFVMLTLLILGKKYVKNENIDVYLQPLVEELQELWKWVRTLDATKLGGKFLLRAICMWNLHNFAYCLFVGGQTKGYLACPLCGPEVDTKRFSHLKKKSILGTGITLLKATHIRGIILHSMDKWRIDLHRLKFQLSTF